MCREEIPNMYWKRLLNMETKRGRPQKKFMDVVKGEMEADDDDINL